MDGEFEQEAGRFVATLAARGPAITLELAIPIPPGARDVRSSLPRESSTEELYVVSVQLSQTPSRIEVEWTGGLQVEPPTVALQPGQPSQGLRILDFGYARDRWVVLVEGTAGRTYDVRLHGEGISSVDRAEVVRRDGPVTTIAVRIPNGRERETVEIVIYR